jgi:hypothetical protein
MKKLLFSISILMFVTACSSTSSEESVDTEEQEVIEAVPTEEKRDEFLSSNEYIEDFEHKIEKSELDEDMKFNRLIIKMNNDFAQKKISEHYTYLVDFYETYNEKYGELLRNVNNMDFLNSLEVYFGDTEFPTYKVHESTFNIVAVEVYVDRDIGEKVSEKMLIQLDKLEKEMVMSGKERGLTLIEKESNSKEPLNQVIFSTSGEIIREGVNTVFKSSQKNTPAKTNTGKDSETYIKGMTGDDWVQLTDNQRFHAISNALYSLDQNGFVIEESEYYYIDALNEFYSDNFTRNTSVNEALVSIGKMSGTIYK